MRGKVKGNITRNKGLGEMTAESARRSMFTSEFQRMEILEYSDEAMEILYALMGEDVEPRREFVMTRIDFSEIKE
jgi:DNA gyrase/topoisomerase IV subunit B